MGCTVYANGAEVACKAGNGKVIASFPDVCLTPPPPPAGPIPVPYPNTSFSKDMQDGSSTVMIGGKEVMLKDQSFYKTSPLGNEAATNGQGAGVTTHVITGKTYFIVWSMDVKFEGMNVPRHTDMTTSNHASPMANAFVPNLNSATMSLGKTKYGNQTCRNEVLDGVQGRQKALERQLNGNENCNPKDNAKGLARQAAIPCSALQRRVKVQTQLLAAREEKQAKCFNDPSKDKTEKEKEDRRTHEQAISDTKSSIGNTKARARVNCNPSHPMAAL
jgi:hypothetical protein